MTAARAPSVPAEAPAPAAVAPVATGSAKGKLILIRPDGSEGDSFPLQETTVVGRESAGPFAGDSYLSPQHAEFKFTGPAEVDVKDLDSLNGVYLRIPREEPQEIVSGSIFRVGQEILRYEEMGPSSKGPDGAEVMGSQNPGFLGRIRLVIGRDTYGSSYCVPPNGMHLGRERGDIIFPDDGYVSGLHCRIHGEGNKIFLTDVGSSNGTFIRITERTVGPGALLLMGQQLFRVEM